MATDAPAPAVKTYKGNCHCGAVRFTVAHASLEDGAAVMKCNCSICTRNGYLLIYPPVADVTFTQGRETLAAYAFGQKRVDHYFCPKCGSSIHIGQRDGPFFALNVRTLQDVDLEGLTLTTYDGWNRHEPPYQI